MMRAVRSFTTWWTSWYNNWYSNPEPNKYNNNISIY